jgi:imidazolonepropionase-like amidohydrolase
MSDTIIIRGGLVHDGITPKASIRDILIVNGKITRLGRNLRSPAGAVVLSAAGQQVWPGLVEAHCHIGMGPYGTRDLSDYNEHNDAICPQLDAIDGVDPQNPYILAAAQAGVTCVGTGPGSANVLGGTFLAMKTQGLRIDDMVVRHRIGMKCAFGENPKFSYRDKSVSTRMTTAAKLREYLAKAREYLAKKKAAGKNINKRPAYDIKLEALIPVLKKEIPLKAHAHRADDIFTAIRIAKEFDLLLTLEHCTDGHLIAAELAREGYPLAVGPSWMGISKPELRNKTFATPGILAKAGCQVSIITDSGVVPQEHLATMAALAIKAGMDPFAALQSITINPARHIGVAERVGSIEVGKDADLIICEGSIFEIGNKIVTVLIDGKPVPMPE